VRFDVVIVGGGTAGCVLAARLSENADRRVCLLEAGPDFGPIAEGRWPPEILDARRLPFTHVWDPAADDGRTLGGRLVGGSSAVNACVILEGSRADYDEWGDEWSFERIRPHLDRARSAFETARVNTEAPAPFHRSFVEAAQETGFALLSDPDDPGQPVGVAQYPANVVDGRRWNAALAYLDPARTRPNLVVAGNTLVDRVAFDGARVSGVVTDPRGLVEADTVVLTAGAYFSPAILMRSGVGPESELSRLGIPVRQSLPVGKRLLDHHGADVGWEPSARLQSDTAEHVRAAGLFEPHAVLKAASSHCAPGSWDLHLLSWVSPAEAPGRYDAGAIVFHMKPLSTGRLGLRSTDPAELPVVERGYLSREGDLATLLEGIEIAREVAASEPLRELLDGELRPGDVDPERYVRDTVRNYFHPAGTCPLGDVLDPRGCVLGVEDLVVADASIMPTIPRANTNLTTAAIAERIASGF
jgi:choline dehydrogenase-like flavoprotein